MGVLQGQTEQRFHSEALGSFQLGIGSGLAGRVIAMRHDFVEPLDQIMGRQMVLSGLMGRGRCDGPREVQFVQCVEQLGRARLQRQASRDDRVEVS